MSLLGSLIASSVMNVYQNTKISKKIKERDADSYCSIKSNAWHKAHPEGYEVRFKNHTKNEK